MKKLILTMVAAWTIGGTGAAYVPSAGNLASRKDLAERRFGVFLHWGLYALHGQGEWWQSTGDLDRDEYAKLQGAFNPVAFDARAWVKAIKAGGARYITFTTRHHEGFSMFATKASDYNVMNTTFGRDVVKELADACAAEGIRLNLYYSLVDWHLDEYPLGDCPNRKGQDLAKVDYGRYLAFMKAQMGELLSGRYGKVGAIWFDGEWDHSLKTGFDWRFDELYGHIHALDPDCLVANNHHHAMREGEDLQLIENTIRDGQVLDPQYPLETCETMNSNWGYCMKDLGYKSVGRLVALLVRNAGRGANLLLNIGPQPDGRLPDLALDRLEGVGAWLRENGETVYGTLAGPVKVGDSVVSTEKDGKVYVHVLDETLTALAIEPGFAVSSVREFSNGAAVSFVQRDGVVSFRLPSADGAPDRIFELADK